MSGTRAGGLKAAKKNLAKNPSFYKEIGRRGGLNGTTGGFYTREECNCSTFRFNHTKPMCAGAKGGTISRRVSKKVPQNA